MSETWGRRGLFGKEHWARVFLDTLFHYRGRAYLLHQFVTMPDHFDALITPTTSLEKAVQFIKGGFSRRAKMELHSNMEVWQKGFSDHRIRDLVDYANHVKYIHETPVKKGLCGSAAEYPYSSAHPGFDLDPIFQRLKPRSSAAMNSTAEASSFQNANLLNDGTREGVLGQTKGFKQSEPRGVRNGPQGLKPNSSAVMDGTPEGVPFQSKNKKYA
ncbi:MAG TPA: hypothetical protein VJ756_05020 [Terriglobales bacterium]|nr:hypothetical protein [Terriglobales bacterium]